MTITEDEMQECLEAGELGGTPSEVAAIERAFAFGRIEAIGEVLAELDRMHSSMSAYDAAVDLRHIFEKETPLGTVKVRAVEDAPSVAGVARAQSLLTKLGEMPATNIDLKDAVHDKLSRQVRRAEERAATKQSTALTKMAENAERVVLGEEQAQKMQRMRVMLFALVKQLGRARLTQAELNAIAPKDGLDVKVQPDGSLVVTYLRGRDRG
jgi:hypothetical protein